MAELTFAAGLIVGLAFFRHFHAGRCKPAGRSPAPSPQTPLSASPAGHRGR